MVDTELSRQHKKKVDRLLRERLLVTQKTEKDLKFREICLARAAKDPIWFCDLFVTTYNPRVSPSILPFCLYPAQIDLLNWILDCEKNKQWGCCIKARYVGASYVTTMLMLHKLLFQPDFAGCLASNKSTSVDRIGSPDCLMEKIVLMYRWLPTWMQSIDLDKHRKINLIKNPKLNSTIVGQSGREIGRGGRSTLVLVDEASFVESDEQMIAALSENCDSVCYISTPNGCGNKFYELAQNQTISKFYYRWTSDPRRDPEWRRLQDQKLGKKIAAQELDCSFSASTENQFIEGSWIQACINSHLKIEGMDYGESQAGLDVAVTGNNKTVLTYRQGAIAIEIKTLPASDTTQTALKVDRMMIDDDIDNLCFDADGVGFGVAGALNNLDEPLQYMKIEFHGAAKPSEKYWEALDKTSRDLYLNKRAEAWALVRWRIKNTYDHLNGIQSHEPEEMISIPDDPQLLIDLTKPTVQYTTSGKLKLESKQDMRKRGISSPDYGDSLVYAFYVEYDFGMFTS